MNLVVVGAQWGDEGKGKLIDILSERWISPCVIKAATTPAIRLSSGIKNIFFI